MLCYEVILHKFCILCSRPVMIGCFIDLQANSRETFPSCLLKTFTQHNYFVREEMIRRFYSQLYNVTLPGNVPLPSDTLLGKTGNHCLWSLAKVVMFIGLLFLRGSLQKHHHCMCVLTCFL